MSEPLTTEQVKELRLALTVGDLMAAKREGYVEEQEQGLYATYRAANRTGLINGESFEDFLDLLTVQAMAPLMGLNDPLVKSTEGLPTSATSGE